MLKMLSKMERTRSLIIVGFAILMAVSLVVFYAPTGSNTSISSTNTEVLASVNGDEITIGDVASTLSARGADASMLNRQLAELLLKQMISDRVKVQEAERLGLTVSDEELAERIREENKDSSGKVDIKRYRENVGDVARFEKQVRDSIAIEKLRAFVTASVTVSEEELQREFQRRNTEFGLVYVPIVADKLAEKINASDQELRGYYDQHKEEFRIPHAQKKIRYVFINQEKVGEKIPIPDAELRAEYDKLPEDKKQAGVKVQQIVLRTSATDQKVDAAQAEKAASLVARARGTSGIVTEQAFAELAKGNSEDPATARNGGLMPGVVKKSTDNPDSPYQQVLNMAPGQVTEPIKYKNSYYILRRGDSVPKTFEDAKPELLASLRNRKAYASAAALAQRAADRLKATKDPQKVAQELAAEASMTPADMVRETPFVAPGDDVPNIGSSQQFEEGIKPLENRNDVGERTPIRGGFAIPMLVDKKEPNRIPDFEEVKDKVLKAFRTERAKSQLEETARNLSSSAGSAANLKAAAEKLGLEVKTEDAYRVGSPLGDLDTSAAAEEAILSLKEGEVKPPIKMGDDWVVVGATRRKEADLVKFAEQREMLMQSAMMERRAQVFEDYIQAAQRRLESEGKIKIYEDVLAKLEGSEPTINSPQMPTQSIPIQIPAK